MKKQSNLLANFTYFHKAIPTSIKVEFFLETRQKNFSAMAGKLNLNFHLPGCPADTTQ